MRGVDRGLIRDIEIGAVVWSTTIQTSGGHKAGGVVTNIADTDNVPVFKVLRWDHQQPFIHDFNADEVDDTTVEYFTKPAFAEAQRLFGWLAGQSAKHRTRNVEWVDIASRLAAASTGANFLPKAEARYLAARDAEKAAS